MNTKAPWKIFAGVMLAAFLVACAPKRTETEFAKTKQAETGQQWTEDQMRAAFGADRYDALVAGIGLDSLNLLTYGIGISNMAQLINGITGPGKLTALMSNGTNSRKMTALEVLDLLNKLDDACQISGSFGTDTIGKMTNMINQVTNAGMEGIKNIVHGVTDTTVQGFTDPNGATYNNATARLALMMSLLNETLSVMPTLINDLTAPSGVFSAPGTAKLIRLVNNSRDMRDIAVIINGTTSLSNITAVMAGLNGNIYCSKPEYTSQSTCTGAGGAWTNTACTNVAYATRGTCEGAGAAWVADGIDNMARIINELDRVCSNVAHTNGTACLGAGAVWHTKASKIPVIVNNITVVPNMYNIVNGLTSDGKRPAWPSGLPAAYPGDGGNIFDGVDSMVATMNAINVNSMGDPVSSNTTPFGLNGVKRLAYMVNQLDTTPVYENDTDFEGGVNCVNGQFDNRLNWAFSDNGTVAGTPWFGKSWRSGGTTVQAGSCSLRNDNTAATVTTVTQSAELLANITTAGNMTVYTKTDTLGAYDILRIFVNDTMAASYTQASGGAGFQQRTIALTTGLKRIRFDIHRIPGSTGQAFLDTMVLPGTKGASRTAAEKTAIMMNNLYINASLTNVADLLNNTTAPACVTTPTTCTPTNNNGLDALIYAANRSEYPGGINGISTISMASPGVVTWTGHNLAAGTAVKFQTSGTLPAPLAINTIYYVRNPLANSFNLSTTPSGALINTSSAGSGNHITIALPRLAVTVNGINNLNEMYSVLNNMTTLDSFQQLVAMMDFVETPSNVPDLINGLGAGGGAKTSAILTGLTAAGTSNMLRTLADPSNDGAAVSDVADLINGATATSHVATALTELSLSGNIYMGKSATVTMTIASPGVVTWNGHGYREQSPITFDTTGALPTGITLGQTYYLKSVTANTFRLSATPGGADINTTGTQSGTHTAYAKGELFYDGPTGGPSGGRKFAQFFTAVNTKSVANSQVCTGTPGALNSNFCVKFHFVRIVNDLAASGSGPITIAQIVGNLRPDNGVGGSNGVTRMTEALYGVKTMNATLYTNPLSNATADNFGRMTTLMIDMGSGGPLNMARMVNEVDFAYFNSRIVYLVMGANRMRYMSRFLNEMTSADLMLQLLNNTQTNITRVRDLINGQGNLAYGNNAIATNLASFYTAGSQTGHMPNNAGTHNTNPYGAAGSGLDTFGRMIQFINGITSGIKNVVTLINNLSDVGYMGALKGVTNPNDMPVVWNPDQAGDRNCYDASACGIRNFGYGMVNEAVRIDYLTNLINGVVNLDLFLTIVNGPGSCSNVAYQSRSTCIGGGATWTEGTMGSCSNTAFTTQTACTGGGGAWTANSAIGPNSAHYLKMISIVNDVAGSTRKGAGTKSVGDISILSDVINDLGWYAGAPQTLVNQSRITQVMNDVTYCGINPANDRTITTGPVCSNTAYTNQASCVAAGATWNNASQMILCNQPIGYAYSKLNDYHDPRPRIPNAMLAMDDATPMSVIVGQITTTQKTVRVMNGLRRSNTLIKAVNWMPGEAGRDLINYTNLTQMLSAFSYLANNLDGDEDVAAQAFTSLIFWGNGIGQGAARNGTCMNFTAVGPRRMAGIMNTETGQYLEGLLQKFGWRTVISLMNCGLAPHGNAYESYGGYVTGPAWTNSGTAINPDEGGSTTCGSGTNQDRCMTIPGNQQSVAFKQKEQITTSGTCSNGTYHTRHSCTSNGGTWTDGVGSYVWVFGIKNATMNSNCKLHYPEVAAAYTHSMPLDDTVFLGASVWLNSINAGIGGVWDILKGSGLIGWMLTQSGSITFPPNVGAGYTCTDGGSGSEWSCVDNGMGTAPNTSTYRWGRKCSIPRRSGTNCDLNYTNCETTCQGRWIPDKDWATCRVDPSLGSEPIQ